MASCSICGRNLRFGGVKCQHCKKNSESAPAPLQDLPEGLPVSVPARFRVERIGAPAMVFGVLDTLTHTLREVTNDPLDAADIAGQLNNDLIYALGKRWKAPQ